MFDFLHNLGKSEHQRIEGLLSAYIDGELSPAENKRVEEHLAKCTTCAHSLATLRWTVNLVGELPTVPVPRPFTVGPVPVRRGVGLFQRDWAYASLRWSTALVAILLILVFSGDIALRRFPLAQAPLMAPAEVIGTPAPEMALQAEEGAVEREELAQATPTSQAEARFMAPSAPEATVVVATPPPVIALEAKGGGVTPTGEAEMVLMATPTPAATALAIAKAPIQTPSAEEAAPLQPRRPRLSPLRAAEIALLLILITLATTTVMVGRRR